jgi:hypothetical protein
VPPRSTTVIFHTCLTYTYLQPTYYPFTCSSSVNLSLLYLYSIYTCTDRLHFTTASILHCIISLEPRGYIILCSSLLTTCHTYTCCKLTTASHKLVVQVMIYIAQQLVIFPFTNIQHFSYFSYLQCLSFKYLRVSSILYYRFLHSSSNNLAVHCIFSNAFRCSKRIMPNTCHTCLIRLTAHFVYNAFIYSPVHNFSCRTHHSVYLFVLLYNRSLHTHSTYSS